MTTLARARPPSVDRLLSILAEEHLEVSDREALVRLVREVLDRERRRLASGAPPLAVHIPAPVSVLRA